MQTSAAIVTQTHFSIVLFIAHLARRRRLEVSIAGAGPAG